MPYTYNNPLILSLSGLERMEQGDLFLVAAFVIHAYFIQVHAFVFVLLGESDFDFVSPDFIEAVHFYFSVFRSHGNLMLNSVFEVVHAIAAETLVVIHQ